METLITHPAPNTHFVYAKPGNLALRRFAVWGGAEAQNLADSPVKSRLYESIGTAEASLDEFDPIYIERRRTDWLHKQHQSLVFNNGEKVPSVKSGPLMVAIHEKLDENFGLLSKATTPEKDRFATRIASDAEVSRYEEEWKKRTANGDTVFNPLTYVSEGADSVIGRIGFTYRQDEMGFVKRLAEKSRNRGEAFLKEHSETIEQSINAFPALIDEFISANGLKVDLTVIMERYKEVKDRVRVVSYLDRVMPIDANGVYYAESHGIFLNADGMTGFSKEQVATTVFHELLHATSSVNLVKDHTERYLYRNIGPGVPQADWINEGVTEFIARELTVLQCANEAILESGAYQNEVSILTNILDSNKKIKKLLLSGYFDMHSKGRELAGTRTNKAIALIDYVYGKGFVQHVENQLSLYKETGQEKDVDRIVEYVKHPELARKSKTVAKGILLAFGLLAGTYRATDYIVDQRNRINYLEQEVENENTIVSNNLSPEEALSIISLNTKEKTEIKMGEAPQVEVVLYDYGENERLFSSPIYFMDEEKVNHVIIQDGEKVRVLELGEQDNYAAYVRFVEDDDLYLRQVEPILDMSGKLVDKNTGERIGTETFKNTNND